MEVIRNGSVRINCREYYLLAYIVKHKLTMKRKENKEEFKKRYDE